MSDTLPREAGRRAFGHDTVAYDETRPPYPSWVFEDLAAIGALRAHVATLEIGPGNGLASRALSARGAAPLTFVEPDARFHPHLAGIADSEGNPCPIVGEAFEDAVLAGAFDLIVIATAFHWLDPASRVSKLARLSNPGGSVALVWNVFQDLSAEDAFHEATKHVLGELAGGPSENPGELPFALDRSAREAEFVERGEFTLAHFRESRWTLTLNPPEVRKLYAGFSKVASLAVDDRARILDALEAIATEAFDGVVERHMTTPLYVFHRT